jgi:hypothetical protein
MHRLRFEPTILVFKRKDTFRTSYRTAILVDYGCWSWEFFLRPTVSRQVSLGVGPPFGTLDQILSCSSFVWQLRRSAFNASSLTRKRVWNLLLNCFWVLPEQSHLSRSPTDLTAISYCLIWDSPNLEGQVPVFISPRNRVAQIYPRAQGSLSVASYDSRGLRWRYSNPPPHGRTTDILILRRIYLEALLVPLCIWR